MSDEKNALILASGSTARLKMLTDTGVDCRAINARIDESSVKAAMLSSGHAPREIADALAEMKAQKISQKHPEQLVLGADQVLVFEGEIFDKARDLDEARHHLNTLRGKQHSLLSAAVICLNGRPIFRHIGSAKLHMRPFTDKFIAKYVEQQKDDLLTTVGCYKLEEAGAQLFQKVEGDYFSVLGLPLLPVLGFLRARGMLTE